MTSFSVFSGLVCVRDGGRESVRPYISLLCADYTVCVICGLDFLWLSSCILFVCPASLRELIAFFFFFKKSQNKMSL